MTQLFDAATLPAARASATGETALSVTIIHDLASIRREWDAMIADGCASAYQAFPFHAAWAARSADIDKSLGIAAVLRDATGRAVMILPLSLSRKGPLAIARYPGGKHVNFNMPIALPGRLPADRTALAALMKRIGKAAGIDAFAFVNQPDTWNGRPHPFIALGGQPSPSFAYKLALTGDCETIIKDRMSPDARHKLRRKLNRLNDMGTVRYGKAETREAARAVLDAFLAQKRSRMAAMGLPNPFDEPGIVSFLEQACFEGVENGTPAIRLYGMWLDERIIATYGAVVDEKRFSGMFTAFDASEDVYRWSPGEHMLQWLIAKHCAKGLNTFDLGVGEARYKSQFCDEEERLFDLFLPVTALGSAATMISGAAAAAKRRIKQNERAMALIATMRRKLSALGR